MPSSKPYPRCADYLVYPDGRVRSLKKCSRTKNNNGFMTGKSTKHGYTEHLLSIMGKKVYKRAHQMVLETFVGPRPKGMEACHGDDDPTNNTLGNLRWDTKSANAKDKVRLGVQVGTTHGMCKITEETVHLIRQRYDAGEGSTALARELGLQQSHVASIAGRRIWKHLPENKN